MIILQQHACNLHSRKEEVPTKKSGPRTANKDPEANMEGLFQLYMPRFRSVVRNVVGFLKFDIKVCQCSLSVLCHQCSSSSYLAKSKCVENCPAGAFKVSRGGNRFATTTVILVQKGPFPLRKVAGSTNPSKEFTTYFQIPIFSPVIYTPQFCELRTLKVGLLEHGTCPLK